MSPRARDAHLRMLSTLPRRTHEWRPVTRDWGYKRSAPDEALLKERLAAMRANGATNKAMRLEFGCTNRTIEKLIGRNK